MQKEQSYLGFNAISNLIYINGLILVKKRTSCIKKLQVENNKDFL